MGLVASQYAGGPGKKKRSGGSSRMQVSKICGCHSSIIGVCMHFIWFVSWFVSGSIMLDLGKGSLTSLMHFQVENCEEHTGHSEVLACSSVLRKTCKNICTLPHSSDPYAIVLFKVPVLPMGSGYCNWGFVKQNDTIGRRPLRIDTHSGFTAF